MLTLDASNPSDLERASNLLLGGQIVAVPTETVYGLAALADLDTAVAAIFRVKGRPLIDPLIVHVDGTDTAARLAVWNETAQALADQFWPGPLTLILPSRGQVAALVTAGLPTVALRQPAHPALAHLLSILKRPLAAPSANPFGYISPTCAQHVTGLDSPELAAVLDGGPCRHGIESTILSLAGPEPVILRPGPLGPSDLAKVLRTRPGFKVNEAGQLPEAPGSLPRHYSPRKPLRLFDSDAPGATSEAEAVVFLERPRSPAPNAFWLAEKPDPAEACRSLYALLRRLDADESYAGIAMENSASRAGEEWVALSDRIRRAANSK